MRFLSWMLLSASSLVLLFCMFKNIVDFASRCGWRAVAADLVVFVVLCGCIGLGLFLTFWN